MSLPGREIYRGYDDLGPVQVFDDGNRRFLAFGDHDEQSCLLKADFAQLQHDYTQAMLLPLLFAQPRRALILGLGGGALVHCLHRHVPGLKLQVVELRELVIRTAQRYFQLPRSKHIELICDDAGLFLEDDSQPRVDLLFSDLYSAEGLDLQQTQQWYIELCARRLKPDGWLVLNCWKQHRGEQEMLQALRAHFADIRVCNTAEGNWVILAGKTACALSASALKQEAKRWSKILGYSLIGCLGRLSQY